VDKAVAAERNEAPLDQAVAAEISDVSFDWLAILGILVLGLGSWWFWVAIRRRKRYGAYST
jgi:hypothetical protein